MYLTIYSYLSKLSRIKHAQASYLSDAFRFRMNDGDMCHEFC